MRRDRPPVALAERKAFAAAMPHGRTMTTSGRRFSMLAAIATLVAVSALARAGAQGTAPDVARGRHLATAVAGCADCHGSTFAGGRAFTRNGQTVYAANLTGGAGGIGSYADADLRRAIRTGVRPDGSHLRIMPVSEYAVLSDADVDDLVAFLRSLPPVDHAVTRPPAVSVPAGSMTTTPMPRDGAAAAPLSGGAYLATVGGCTNCHGANLAGSLRPNGSRAPNISHDGIGNWSFTDFQTAMRTGKTPDGRVLSTAMPWPTVGQMTDDELRAIYDFLESKSSSG